MVSIRESGGKDAYERMAREIDSLTPDKQHTRAHAFGAALYAVEGVRGLSVCDARYSYGCFHEFLGRAIAALGLGAVNDLNDECFSVLTTSPLSCQHGIGHGVVSYLGYTERDLIPALDICRDLPKSDPIGGCYGGVFMEYNMRTMLGENGGARAVGVNGLHEPCASFDDTYRAPCYYWQPQWWHQVFQTEHTSEEEIFSKIGALCEEAKDDEIVRACFEGLGTITASSADFDAERSRDLCKSATDNPRNQLFCLSLAANSLFVGGAGKTGDAPAVCSDLQGDASRYCLSYASNTSNILQKAQLPESFR
jgi:hypothetical protein